MFMDNRFEKYPIKKVVPYVAATVLAAGKLFSPESVNAEPIDTTPLPAQPMEIQPSQMVTRIDQLIEPTVDAWRYRQSGNGQFKDPVKGRQASYSSPMLAQAMIELGVKRNDPGLISQGLKAEKAQINHPDNGGFNVGFEVIGLVDSIKQNDYLLAENGQWQSLRGPLTEFVAKRYNRGIERKTKRANEIASCMTNPKCFYNLKLVAATASIDYHLNEIGINTKIQPRKKLSKKASISFNVANPAGKTTKARGANDALLEQAARLTSKDAKTSTWNEASGILSDPAAKDSNNPLAYNALSSMMLGHALEAKGYDGASVNVKNAFERTAKSIVGYMAPDGETSYIGRGQGQVWVPAIALNALAIAAKNASDPAWKGRYLSASDRLINHIEKTYAPNQFLGMPLAPRLKEKSSKNTSYNGLDYYASYNMYEGLALYGLRQAREILKTESDLEASQPTSEIDSVFIDPSQTKFATVKSGNIWYAIHGGDAQPDARYDFGIIAAQKKVGDVWLPATAHRPHTKAGSSAGGAFKIKNKLMLPTAQKIINRGNGVIDMYGGWTDKPNGKPTIDKNTKWTFTPVENGVNMQFIPKNSRRYEFKTWFEAGSRLIKSKNGLTVIEPNGRQQSYTFNHRVSIKKDKKSEYSAYDKRLNSARIVLNAKKGKTTSITTTF